MACFTVSLKLINYLISALLVLIGIALAITAIVGLATPNNEAFTASMIAVLVLCVLIVIVGALGACATKKGNRILLGIFCCVAGILFVLCFLSALAGTTIMSQTHYLADLDNAGLNGVDPDSVPGGFYVLTRDAYAGFYSSQHCRGPSCRFVEGELRCPIPIQCDTNSLTKSLNDLLYTAIKRGNPTASSLSVCENDRGLDDPFYRQSGAVNAWCISRTAAMARVDGWTLGTGIVLWALTAFLLLISITNGLLACTLQRKSAIKGGVILAMPAGTPQRRLNVINYTINGILICIGVVLISFSLYALVSKRLSLTRHAWLYGIPPVGVILILLGLLGCWATKRRKLVVMAYYCGIAALLFVFAFIAALGFTLRASDTHYLSNLARSDLNTLDKRPAKTYAGIRASYAAFYTLDGCSGPSCSQDAICTNIRCSSPPITEALNSWLSPSPIASSTFDKCIADALSDEQFDIAIAEGWCSSNITVLDLVNYWTIAILTALWFSALFVLLVSTNNGLIVFCSADSDDHSEEMDGVYI
ncbi:hypothetical protein FOL47_001865 [Perkinsus chesapeaki]|uniref:Uncharacterized protein n=1 Tax=Perkinsus chesapeaki TaxID=330153 RepID=A0A7J6MH03_PERCH|nr:hypothetical protein FOL47_001865 [Perkinsus chesapeaki]